MLSIGVIASLKQEEYKRQALACIETWVKDAEELNIPVTFFCGDCEERYFFTSSNVEFVHFPLTDDYLSATYKTWFGFRQLLEKKADYYLMVASDNYVEVKKTLETLSRHPSSTPSLIGGYAQARTMERQVVFPSGGGGLTLTRSALEDLSPHIEYYMEKWKKRCLEVNNPSLLPACDVSLADAIWERGYSLIIEKGFYPCSWRGILKKPEKENFLPVNLDILCTHHYLDDEEMFFYHKFKTYAKEYLELEKKYGKIVSSFPYSRAYVKGKEEFYLFLLVRENIKEFQTRLLYVDRIEASLKDLGEMFQVEVKKYQGEEVDYSH